MRFFLLIALLAGLGCGKRSITGINIDPAFRRLILPDTKVLAGVRVDQLKASPFYKRHEKQLQIPLLDAFSERMGVDPRRDLSDLLVQWNGKQPVFVARGRIAQPQLEQKLSSLGVVFIGKGIAVGGSSDAVHSVINLHDHGAVPNELQQRLEALPTQDQIWLVGRGGIPFADVPMRSDIGSALSNIVAFVSGASVGIELDSSSHLQMEITCISDQGAQRVRDALRGGIGLARLTTKDNEPDMLRLYDSIHVEEDHQLIYLRADLPADLTDQLLAHLLLERASSPAKPVS